MSMMAVRHSPISALGAQGGAFSMPIVDADVRQFGEKSMWERTRDTLRFLSLSLFGYKRDLHV